MAGAVAQARATTIRFTFWAALGTLVLPGLAGADDPCADVTDGTIRNRADIRALGECAPASALRAGTAEAEREPYPRAAAAAGAALGEAHSDYNGLAPETDRVQGTATPVRRAVLRGHPIRHPSCGHRGGTRWERNSFGFRQANS